MKIEVDINEKYEELKVIVQAPKLNEEVSEIVEKLSINKEPLKVYLDEEMYFVKECEIESIYSESGKVFVRTDKQIYQSKKRLYEFELILSKNKFVRISNSEIINFDKVKNINNKILGTISINFFSGHQTYASRRFIKKIKEFLDI